MSSRCNCSWYGRPLPSLPAALRLLPGCPPWSLRGWLCCCTPAQHPPPWAMARLCWWCLRVIPCDPPRSGMAWRATSVATQRGWIRGMPQGSSRGTAPVTAYCASGGDAPWDCCLGCVYLPGCPTQPCDQVCGIMQCSDRATLQCINGIKQSLTGAVWLRL
jgi:hypothetical protein